MSVLTLGMFCLLVGVSQLTEATLLTCPPSIEESTIRRLKSSLFCDYDPLEKPVKNREDNVTINFFLKTKYLSFEGYRNKFEISTLFLMTWQDEFLTWDSQENDNITQLLIPSYQMWFPDVFILSSDMEQHALQEENLCEVSNSGNVQCTAQVNTLVYCLQELTHWPFDKQICNFGIISYGHEIEDVDLKFKEKGYDPKVVHNSNGWNVINMNASITIYTYVNPNYTHPQLEYTFKIQRHGNLYEVVVFAPVFVTSTLTLLSFWVSKLSYRTRLCCASLLGDVFCLLYIGSRIKATGNTTPSIVLFYRDSMLMTIFAMVLGICLERLKDRTMNIHVPVWLMRGALWLQVRGGRSGQLLLGDDDSMSTSSDEEDIHSPPKCRKYAILFNRLAFLVAFITFVVMLVAMLL